MSFESSQRGLQICFKPHFNYKCIKEVIGIQSGGSLNFENFGIIDLESYEKCHLSGALVVNHIKYYKGKGGGFPQVQIVVSLVNP